MQKVCGSYAEDVRNTFSYRMRMDDSCSSLPSHSKDGTESCLIMIIEEPMQTYLSSCLQKQSADEHVLYATHIYSHRGTLACIHEQHILHTAELSAQEWSVLIGSRVGAVILGMAPEVCRLSIVIRYLQVQRIWRIIRGRCAEGFAEAIHGEFNVSVVLAICFYDIR